jgi:catechol 2,3-dioxygenase-like lactoylglutathione lyase family enzyme
MADLPLRGLVPLLQVFDMPASLAFYRDKLGFAVVQRAPAVGEHIDWALLRLGDIELMLNTMYEADQRPPAPDPARTKAHADTALYFGCPDVDAAYERLRGLGLRLQPPVVAPYGMKQLYVLDPDGYNVCLQWPADP